MIRWYAMRDRQIVGLIHADCKAEAQYLASQHIAHGLSVVSVMEYEEQANEERLADACLARWQRAYESIERIVASKREARTGQGEMFKATANDVLRTNWKRGELYDNPHERARMQAEMTVVLLTLNGEAA